MVLCTVRHNALKTMHSFIFFSTFRPFLSAIVHYTELEAVEFGDFKTVDERAKFFQDLNNHAMYGVEALLRK